MEIITRMSDQKSLVLYSVGMSMTTGKQVQRIMGNSDMERGML